jgi:DNA polymerase III subunit beta
MNATVNRIALTAAAKLASDTADPKATQELLAHALLRFTRKGLVVAATDLTTSIWSEVAFPSLAAPGSICVDARRFSAAVASLPGADVSVSVDDKLKVTLKSGKATVALAGRKGEDFPAIPDVAAGSEVPPAAFAAAIDRAAYVRGLDELRFPGPYLSVKDGRCTLASVTSHRFAVSEFAAPALKDHATIVVPANGMAQIASALDGQDSARLSISDGRLSVAAGAVCVSVKLADVAPVAWQNIIEHYFSSSERDKVRISREELLAAARRAGMMSGNGEKLANGINLTLDGPDLTVASAMDGFGEASTTVSLDGKTRPETIRLSWRYLADALGAIEGDSVEFDYGSKLDPVLLRSPGSPELHLVMVQSQ